MRRVAAVMALAALFGGCGGSGAGGPPRSAPAPGRLSKAATCQRVATIHADNQRARDEFIQSHTTDLSQMMVSAASVAATTTVKIQALASEAAPEVAIPIKEWGDLAQEAITHLDDQSLTTRSQDARDRVDDLCGLARQER